MNYFREVLPLIRFHWIGNQFTKNSTEKKANTHRSFIFRIAKQCFLLLKNIFIFIFSLSQKHLFCFKSNSTHIKTHKNLNIPQTICGKKWDKNKISPKNHSKYEFDQNLIWFVDTNIGIGYRQRKFGTLWLFGSIIFFCMSSVLSGCYPMYSDKKNGIMKYNHNNANKVYIGSLLRQTLAILNEKKEDKFTDKQQQRKYNKKF